MSDKNNQLARDPVGRLLVHLSLPAIVGMVLYSLFSLVDTFFVARLGTPALAALTISIPIEILLVSVGSATGIGVTSLLSRTLGRQDYQRADNIAWHGLIICVLYGFIFPALGLYNIDRLLHVFGCTTEIYGLARQYLCIILVGCIFTFLPMMAGSVVQGEGNTVLPMVTALAGIMLNVLLDPILIFGAGPIPAMGLNGAAWATVIAQIFCAGLGTAIMVRRSACLTWSKSNFSPSLAVIRGIYSVGLPSLLMELLGVIIMVVFNKVLLSFGFLAVAISGIFVRIRSLFYMPVFGLAQGVVPMVGYAYGARNYDRVKESIIKSTGLSLFFISLGWFVMQFQGEWLMKFFTNDPYLIVGGKECLFLATIVIPVMGPLIILSNVLQALGQGTTAMWLSIIRQAGFFLPSIIILPLWLGLNGVWLAFTLSEFLSALLGLVFFSRLWKNLQVGKRYAVMTAFKKGYIWERIMTWFKW